MIEITNIIYLLIGVLFAGGGYIIKSFINRHIEKQNKADAKKILERYGLSPHRYIPNIETKDDELRWAFYQFAYDGYIILNADGNQVTGKLLSPYDNKTHLKLIVSNP